MTPLSSLVDDGLLRLVFRGGLPVVVKTRGETVLSLRVDLRGRYQGVEEGLESVPLFAALGFLRNSTGPYALSHVVAYVESVEELLMVPVSFHTQLLRIILCEGERIEAHLSTLGRMAQCVGILPLFSYVYRFRQRAIKLAERLWGTGRLVDVVTIGGFRYVLPNEFVSLWVDFWLQEVPPLLNLLETVFLQNPIFKGRTVGLGILSSEDVVEMGLSGSNARASGFSFDARCFGVNASLYGELGAKPLVASRGDVWARMQLRFEETRQSLAIMQAGEKAFPKTVGSDEKVALNLVGEPYPLKDDPSSLEKVEREVYPIRRCSRYVESPNGEFAVFAVGDGQRRLQRCHILAPSFKALQAFERLCAGQNITDLEILLRSLDIRVGEMRR